MELHDITDRKYEGDVQAFSELASRYRDMALGYAMTIVGREQAAEDAVQEAMILAYANLDRLRQPHAFAAWLRGIVRHQCYRVIRSEPGTVSLEAVGEEADECFAPPLLAAKSPMWDQVNEAIKALPDSQREVIQLHYESGLSQREVAAQLELTVGTVNMRLHAARSRLRRRLTQMTDETAPINNPGRIQEVNSPLITIQFPPHLTPPILSVVDGQGQDSLCVVQQLTAGRVAAVSATTGRIWTPGQEVIDTGMPFTDALDEDIIGQVLGMLHSPRPGTPLASGIKAIDVFAPLTQSGTTGIFTEWGLGVLVLLPELLRNLDKESNRQTVFVLIPPVTNAQHWNELTAEITVGSRNISILYLPVADPIRKGFIDSCSGLDSRLVLSRHLSEQAIWPCIDPLACRSRRLDEALDDNSHLAIAGEVRDLLRTYYTLQFSIDDAARHTLTASEHVQIQRARKALRYLSQPFFVAEPYTKRQGEYVEPVEAKKGFADILAGRYDGVHRDAFYMTGGVPK